MNSKTSFDSDFMFLYHPILKQFLTHGSIRIVICVRVLLIRVDSNEHPLINIKAIMLKCDNFQKSID